MASLRNLFDQVLEWRLTLLFLSSSFRIEFLSFGIRFLRLFRLRNIINDNNLLRVFFLLLLRICIGTVADIEGHKFRIISL